MSKVKDYYGELFLDKEANIKLDFIHSETDNPYDKIQDTNKWILTINTGVTDEKGYVDALIIDIDKYQYPTFLSPTDKSEIDFEVTQFPKCMSENQARDLLFKYADEIVWAITDFENE